MNNIESIVDKINKSFELVWFKTFFNGHEIEIGGNRCSLCVYIPNFSKEFFLSRLCLRYSTLGISLDEQTQCMKFSSKEKLLEFLKKSDFKKIKVKYKKSIKTESIEILNYEI